MKFRTEAEARPFSRKIGYGSRIFTIGSCFADNMAAALAAAKFRVTANPAGVLFNPASIGRMLRMFDAHETVGADELVHGGERIFDYRFHGSLAALTEEEALRKINGAIDEGHRALADSDTVIITFGTAWIYTLNATGGTVANCHKQPASFFTRRRLSVGEIVDDFSVLMETLLAHKQVIFTVSPVRHLADGADENFLSKATLRMAIAELTERYGNACYFPAYEIMNDDLRDYRFYGEDMVHPTPQAVAYIREKFFAAALSDEARALIPRVEKIVAAAAHRPLDPRSKAYADFVQAALAAIGELQNLPSPPDLSAEAETLRAKLQ